MSDAAPLQHEAACTTEIVRLTQRIQHLEHAERVQRALFAIADLAGSQLDMREVLRRVHEIVAGLMYAQNLYIARYDAAQDTISFIYFVDVATPAPERAAVPMRALEHSLTWHVIRERRALRGTLDAIADQVGGRLKALGADARDWLGVPMLDGGEVRGVLVVQSYDQADLFTAADQALLEFVASHVLTALERRQARADLESAVQARTAELAAANAELVRQVRLQRSLYRIAELASRADSIEAFCKAVHEEVGELLLAKNFFIALLSEDGRMLHFPYYVNEYDPPSPSRPLGNNVTEYVLRLGSPVLLDQAGIARLAAAGEFAVNGLCPISWLGVPLRCEGRTLGVMTVQTYSGSIRYTQADQDLLQFVSHQIASSLERRRALASLH
ncbi:MAG TPA: GAF domain-containing protein, partial [Noviherbaspirillum sp.]|nr:GAF domain-containing protein [Noviherbaspirillum sp.]